MNRGDYLVSVVHFAVQVAKDFARGGDSKRPCGLVICKLDDHVGRRLVRYPKQVKGHSSSLKQPARYTLARPQNWRPELAARQLRSG